MDAIRRHDGKHVMLKKVSLEKGPQELRIAQLFSSPDVARDPRNHCVPLLDVIEIPDAGQKLMVMPFLRPFNNPRFQTFGEFVAFFTQTCEVSLIKPRLPRSNLIALKSGYTIHARAEHCTQGLHGEQHHVQSLWNVPTRIPLHPNQTKQRLQRQSEEIHPDSAAPPLLPD